MISIESAIKIVLDAWNVEVKNQGLKVSYELDVACRNKKFYLNKTDFFEQRVAELKLIQKGEQTLLLYRKELRMPERVAKTPQHRVDADYLEQVYKYFLYEAIGSFCVTTKGLIERQDYAEYDIENDRLKQHDGARGMVIRTTKDGEFYAVGNEFDVFIELDGDYAVYTSHDIARTNNGIAKIPKPYCIIAKAPIPKILL